MEVDGGGITKAEMEEIMDSSINKNSQVIRIEHATRNLVISMPLILKMSIPRGRFVKCLIGDSVDRWLILQSSTSCKTLCAPSCSRWSQTPVVDVPDTSIEYPTIDLQISQSFERQMNPTINQPPVLHHQIRDLPETP